MKRTWPRRRPRRGYSASTGSFTPRTRSAVDQISSGSATILAPVATNSSSEMEEPSPAPFSTQTVWPWEVSSRTPAGVMATRYSSSFTSLGTPTITVVHLRSSFI